jgi:anti-sigma factor RsiW
MVSTAYDGALSDDERTFRERHRAHCAACRQEEDRSTALLDRVGPMLHALVDREAPRAPFPEPRPGLWQRLGAPLRYAAIGLGAAASLLVGLRLPSYLAERGGRGEPAFAAVGHEEDCPWRQASPRDVARTVSYPVVADECLDHQFELVAASVTQGRSCAENVRLTYRSGSRHLVLEQHPDTSPTACPHGEKVLVGEVAGCFDRLARGVGQLRWNHRDLAFALTGDVATGEAVLVARNIAQSLED